MSSEIYTWANTMNSNSISTATSRNNYDTDNRRSIALTTAPEYQKPTARAPEQWDGGNLADTTPDNVHKLFSLGRASGVAELGGRYTHDGSCCNRHSLSSIR